MWGCSILIRRHDPKLNAAMEEWADTIVKFSRRDQLSFDYIMWKHHVPHTKIAAKEAMYQKLNVNYQGHSGSHQGHRNVNVKIADH